MQEVTDASIVIAFSIFTLAPLFDLIQLAVFDCFFYLNKLTYFFDLIILNCFLYYLVGLTYFLI